MRVAVLGTGMVGRGHAAALQALGHGVTMGTRNPAQRNGPERASANIEVASFSDAIAGADIVINALNGAVAVEVLSGLTEVLAGSVLVDLTNPLEFSGGQVSLFVCNTDSLGEQIQRAVPAARVVKTLCTVNVEIQVNPARIGDGHHTMFLAGDDPTAKGAVADVLRQYGWREIVDLGGITAARGMEMMMPMWLQLSRSLGTSMINYRVVTDGTPSAADR